MTRHSRPWAKKHVHPLITIGFLVVSIVFTGLLWKVILTPMTEPTISIVEGEFPQKQEPTPETSIATTEAVDEPEQQTSPYPILLTNTQSSEINVVVNKKHRLSSDYVPALVSVRGASMRQEAANQLESMFAAVETAGITPKVLSSYRSYNTQVAVYNGYVSQYGQAQADTFSARAGHSEHQTGLAVDVGGGGCDLEICFGSTPFGEWIKSNAHLYGYIVRYPEGKESLTGYQYEPWHLRYVGVDVADGIIRSKQTLDQYFNKPAGGY